MRPSRWEPSGRSGRSIDLRRTLRAAAGPAATRSTGVTAGGAPWPRPIVHAGRRLRLDAGVLADLPAGAAGCRARRPSAGLRVRHPTASGDPGTGPRAPGGRHRQGAPARRTPPAAPGSAAPSSIFLDTDGRRGLARGAVVVIVSDGWERADPALLGEQMARLSRLAHRVIWVNPRKGRAGLRPTHRRDGRRPAARRHLRLGSFGAVGPGVARRHRRGLTGKHHAVSRPCLPKSGDSAYQRRIAPPDDSVAGDSSRARRRRGRQSALQESTGITRRRSNRVIPGTPRTAGVQDRRCHPGLPSHLWSRRPGGTDASRIPGHLACMP